MLSTATLDHLLFLVKFMPLRPTSSTVKAFASYAWFGCYRHGQSFLVIR